MTRSTMVLCASGAIALAAGTVNAQFFIRDNLVITQVGDGAAALSSAGTQMQVIEYRRNGTATGTSLNLSLAGGSGRILERSFSAFVMQCAFTLERLDVRFPNGLIRHFRRTCACSLAKSVT